MQKNHFLFYEEGNPIPFALETYRIKGSFRENLELWDFPLDYQVWKVFNKVFNNKLLFIKKNIAFKKLKPPF